MINRRPTVWELVPDWRAAIAENLLKILWIILAIGIAPIPFTLIYYYDPANTKVGRNDQHNAEHVLQWLSNNSVILFFITVSYVIMLIFLQRRMKTFLKSKVTLQGVPLFSQLSFRRNRNDAVQLMILYLTFLLLVVGIITLLIQ